MNHIKTEEEKIEAIIKAYPVEIIRQAKKNLNVEPCRQKSKSFMYDLLEQCRIFLIQKDKEKKLF